MAKKKRGKKGEDPDEAARIKALALAAALEEGAPIPEEYADDEPSTNTKKNEKDSKSSKGKKKKKKKKKGKKLQSKEDDKPKYTQKDIDDYIKKREREKKKRKERKLVDKMLRLITVVRSDDPRWNTWTLAPLYNFLRTPEIDVITIFLKKQTENKEDKSLIWEHTEDAQESGGVNFNSSKRNIDAKSVVRYGSIEEYDKGDSLKLPAKSLNAMKIEQSQSKYTIGGNHLVVLNSVIPNDSPDLFYFVKLRPVPIDRENFFYTVTFGNIPGGILAAAHNLMAYVLTPTFYQPSILPESVRNDFFSSINGFMGSLTETYNRLLLQTKLYVPREATAAPIDIVSKDKELCARLEGAMVHWIRQIKEVVNTQTMQDMDDWSGPLDEIAFWKSRTEDLAGLTAQIQSAPVRTIQQVMTIIKSPFVTSYNTISAEILGASEEAISNLEYLQILIEPCTKLHHSKVADIPGQIDELLRLVRKIWLESPYYNTRRRLNGLLRKVSNEIISHCIEEINEERVFKGYIQSSEALINECIECLKSWKQKYFEAEHYHHQFSNLSWLLEYDHIFSHVDAFLHRLNDLIEICVVQRLYGRRIEGNQDPLPTYPPPRGNEMTRVMKKIQKILDRNLGDLYQHRELILDVKRNAWHDHMMNFKSAVRDMETMIQNLLFSVFDSVTHIEQGIEILQLFYVFYQRDIITRAYDKLIVRLYKIFEDYSNLVRNILTKNIIPQPTLYASLAGRAAWALDLKRRLDAQLELLQETTWLPDCGYGEDVVDQTRILSQTLADFLETMYQSWLKAVGTKDLYSRLEIPLMARSTVTTGMIEVNFDPFLARLIVEGEMWEKMGYKIPEVFQYVYDDRYRLTKLRETVLLVLKDFNNIISALSPEELNLFKERIKVLNRKVYPGLTKLTWVSDVSDSYIRDCRQASNKVQDYTNDYKKANLKIAKLANKMSTHLMIKVDQKKVHEGNDFNEYQDIHRSKAVLKMANEYKKITIILRQVFEMFKEDGPEVKNQWIKYLRKIDRIVEEAFCVNMRRSLKVLLRVVMGDLRGPPPSIFKLVVILDSNKLAFDPSLVNLEDMILGVYRRICITIKPFPRVVQFLNDSHTQAVSFAQVLAKDEVSRLTQEKIADGLFSCLREVEKYLKTWEPYRDVWELNKDEFMEKYESLRPSVESYDTDIRRYFEVLDAVQGSESIVTVSFCIIDCQNFLKNIVSDHCREWRERLMQSLYTLAYTKLLSVYDYMDENLKKFKEQPTALPELVEQFKEFRLVQHDVDPMEKTFPNMHQQFAVLAKYEFQLGANIQSKVETFEEDWGNYLKALNKIKKMLKSAKEKLRKIFLNMADEFKKRVNELIRSFETQGPYNGNTSSEKAAEMLYNYRATMYKLQKDEQDLLSSLTIFEIDIPENENLKNFEPRLALLESVWLVVYEWDDYWDEYRKEPFRSMETENMDEVATIVWKRLLRLQSELEKEGKKWTIVKETIARVEVFKRSIPVINELRNPALKKRHWEQVFKVIKAWFDPEDEGFTFDVIVSYGMEKYANEISNIVALAETELEVENTLKTINDTWTTEKLDMVPYNNTGHYRLNINQDMIKTLEDHINYISSIKDSRPAKPFEEEIVYWEKTLSVVKDALDVFLVVQPPWMHMEKIFTKPDVKLQFPKESGDFHVVNTVWKNITVKMFQDSLVVTATHREGLIPVLKDLGDRLDSISKAMEA